MQSHLLLARVVSVLVMFGRRGCCTHQAHTLRFSLIVQAYELMYFLLSMLIPASSDSVESATDGLLESVEVSGVFGGFSCCNCTDC